jgi:hypothetical protein
MEQHDEGTGITGWVIMFISLLLSFLHEATVIFQFIAALIAMFFAAIKLIEWLRKQKNTKRKRGL